MGLAGDGHTSCGGQTVAGSASEVAKPSGISTVGSGLPGGKLELGEDPAACVGREISEETGWAVRVGPILDSWQYHIRDGVDVLIVTYGCFVDGDSPITVSSEHKEARLFAADEIAVLPMPDGYRRSVHDWFARFETPVNG